MAGVNHASISMPGSDGLQGRKRNVTIAGMDSSPGSIEDAEDNDGRDDKRRQPVKRACNECRQQKVRLGAICECDNGRGEDRRKCGAKSIGRVADMTSNFIAPMRCNPRSMG